MNCPVCNSIMIERTGNLVKASLPPMHFYYWWCGCGHTVDIGWIRDKTQEEKARERWEIYNEQ